MKIKNIRRIIRANFKGTAYLNLVDANSQIKDAKSNAIEALNIGHSMDADAVIFLKKSNDTIMVFLYIGKSIILANGINEYLLEYHNGNHDNTNHCIDWLVNNAVDDLKTEDDTFIVLRDNYSDRWRGFTGDEPLSFNEIKARAMMSLN